MHVTLTTIGKLKPSPELDLFLEYKKRLPWKLELKELDIKKSQNVEQAKRDETFALLAACEKCEKIIALDETGQQFTSVAFAKCIGNWQTQGTSSIGIIIGGADGLDKALAAKEAHLMLSLGMMSYPHMLARVLIMEQLYRAHSVISGHPYHRN